MFILQIQIFHSKEKLLLTKKKHTVRDGTSGSQTFINLSDILQKKRKWHVFPLPIIIWRPLRYIWTQQLYSIYMYSSCSFDSNYAILYCLHTEASVTETILLLSLTPAIYWADNTSHPLFTQLYWCRWATRRKNQQSALVRSWAPHVLPQQRLWDSIERMNNIFPNLVQHLSPESSMYSMLLGWYLVTEDQSIGFIPCSI